MMEVLTVSVMKTNPSSGSAMSAISTTRRATASGSDGRLRASVSASTVGRRTPNVAINMPPLRTKSSAYGDFDKRASQRSTTYIVKNSWVPRFSRRARFCRSR
jgi:hypothetical protein